MSEPVAVPVSSKPSVRERLQGLVAEYGWVALWVYAGVDVLMFGTFLALALGAPVEPGAGRWAVFGVAYLGFKGLMPVRIALTVLLTPLVARWIGKAPAKAREPTAVETPSDAG